VTIGGDIARHGMKSYEDPLASVAGLIFTKSRDVTTAWPCDGEHRPPAAAGGALRGMDREEAAVMAKPVGLENRSAGLEKRFDAGARIGETTVDVHESTEVSMTSIEARGQASIEGSQGRPDAMSGALSSNGTGVTTMTMDRDSELWVEQLRQGDPHRDQAVARLHDVLLRIAYHELSRRRGQLGSINGPEFEDLAQQAADDALMSILGKLEDFRGLSRFTTWAYKFVIFEVSGKVARHAWRRHPPSAEAFIWEGLPDSLAPLPGDRLEQREQLQTLSAAIGELTDRQREVFVAVALNDVSIDLLATKLGSNRNAIYKNLFDARRNLRTRMAEVGHPVLEQHETRWTNTVA
jgi:RNA polymerase sigma-70 factor, ECF subfamily